MVRYKVTLTAEERQQLERLVSSGNGGARAQAFRHREFRSRAAPASTTAAPGQGQNQRAGGEATDPTGLQRPAAGPLSLDLTTVGRPSGRAELRGRRLH